MSDLTPLLKRIEVVLFLENQLIEEKRLAGIIQLPLETLSSHMDALNQLYRQAGSVFCVKKLGDSYQLYIDDGYTDQILERYKSKKKKLSKAVLETLAIIAYKQPITKAEVDAVRGVNCGNYVRLLFEESFIKLAGKKDLPGKPNLYCTSNKFLMHFGLSSLEDLPSLKEIKAYDFLEEQELKMEEDKLEKDKAVSQKA